MKTKNHKNDEPTVLPSDCTCIIFRNDGSVEMFVPHMNDDDDIGAAGLNIMRAGFLFGNSEDCDRVRAFVDQLIAANQQEG